MNNSKPSTSANATENLLKGNNADNNSSPGKKGWLLKWTNYIKGYQRRWFVLSNGVLSYYRSQSEVNHACRGTISLHGALIHTVDSLTFVISNGGTQTFHIKASNEVERQSWVTALELAKAKAIRAMETEEQEEQETENVIPAQEINTVVRDLTDRLENLRTCYDLITKHGVALQRALSDLETVDEETFPIRTKLVNERATLFRLTSNAMLNACNDYLRTAETQGHKWSKILQHERDQRLRLEDMVEQLAKQHTILEKAAELGHLKLSPPSMPPRPLNNPNLPNIPSNVTSDDENEFFDAQENHCPDDETDCNDSHDFIMKVQPITETAGSSSESEESKSTKMEKKRPSLLVIADTPGTSKQANKSSNSPTKEDADNIFGSDSPSNIVAKQALEKSTGRAYQNRRTRVPDKPNHPLNLWSIMKNCIGKDLSKIPMPVNFSEPLSMLQRLTEDYEYSELLDAAARCRDACEQLAYIAAFTVSSYSSTAYRTAKPFNPLLGETYECDRVQDLGWRCMSEQVSHHPPIAAMHCEGRQWTCWQEFTMTSKFRGKYLQVIPMGNAFAQFPETGNKYSWRKVTTTVNNIIVGKLWVDQTGDMEINGLATADGLKCVLNFLPYSYFNKEQQRRVKGVVINRKNEVKWIINGTWNESIDIAPVLSTSGPTDSPIYQTGPYKTIWRHRPPPPGSEAYYNFSEFTSSLNEPEEGVAPTDSRMRPDQRLMEEGRWTESNKIKVRLEEKQREKRRNRESEAETAAAAGEPIPPYQPVWFSRKKDEHSDIFLHVFNNTYWEHKENQDWSVCPDIF